MCNLSENQLKDIDLTWVVVRKGSDLPFGNQFNWEQYMYAVTIQLILATTLFPYAACFSSISEIIVSVK